MSFRMVFKTAALSLALLGTLACASVPPEAVELSQAVGQRLLDMQASHEAFVSAYFRLSRARLDSFLEQRWVPGFLESFVRDSELRQTLDGAQPFSEADLRRLREELSAALPEEQQGVALAAFTSALADAERGQVVLEFAQAAQEEIEKKRRALLDPLERQEAKALAELRAAYGELAAMQGTVTAHLISVRNVQVEQDEILKRLGLLQKRDAVIDDAVELNDKVLAAIGKGEAVEKTLTDLKDILEAKGESHGQPVQ